MLQDLGAFRTITADSLQKHLYRRRMTNDSAKTYAILRDQRLVTVQPDSRGKWTDYISLTRAGKELDGVCLCSNREQVRLFGNREETGIAPRCGYL